MTTTPSSTRDPVLDVSSLTFVHGNHTVLDRIDLTVYPGEILVILGPNGVGKTTLIENILGSYSPTSGTIQVFGHSPHALTAPQWARIGLVQQHWNDHPKWTVLNQLTWISELAQATGRTTKPLDDILHAAGLTDHTTAQLRKLSGGLRRRVDIAAALITSPDLLIVDEPTASLDPQGKADIHDLIADCNDAGATIIMTTHDLAEAEKLASRIVIMGGGRIIAEGTPLELREAYSQDAEITWVEDGIRHVHATAHPEQFLLTLDLHRISGLTVTRPTVEDAYLALISQHTAHESDKNYATSY